MEYYSTFCIKGREKSPYAFEQLVSYLKKTNDVDIVDFAGEGICCVSLEEDTDTPKDSFKIKVDTDSIKICSGSVSGFVYGVYSLLEMWGYRFFAPDCEKTPDKLIKLQPGEHIERPSFIARELFWREAMDGSFAVKLKLNSARSSIEEKMGGKLMYYNFSHSFNDLVPVERYFDEHPEYFSEIDGKRTKNKTQLCLTNPDVLQIVIDGVLKWKKENPDYKIFSVSMNDWYNNCTCENCHKIDSHEESGAGTVIHFVNKVAEEVEKTYPNIFIHTFAYLYCRKPPKYLKPRHNVIIRLCGIENCFSHPIEECGAHISAIDVQQGNAASFRGEKQDENLFLKDLKGWAKIAENLFIWDYTTNYANYLQPFPNINVLQKNIKTYKQFNVKGVFAQGNFAFGHASALAQLKIYILAKLLWNADENVETLIHEFCESYYGKAGATMEEYAKLFLDAGEHHAGIYDSPAAPYLSNELLFKADELLKSAFRKETENPYLERLQREHLSIRYVLLARENLSNPDREKRIDLFAQDARRLGISELFERKDFDSSIKFLKETPLNSNRKGVLSISYPL
ncbi:MAG: DUF4838 domain-containing protein [Eubacteriales bacterium]|nr:DUF4838 domain-containing protein [Eubacteriales bacterium]